MESTVFDALEKPLSAITLEVARVLGRLRPGMHVVGVERFFDVDTFASAGHCTLSVLKNTPSYARLDRDERQRLVPDWMQAWRTVQWEGRSLELVTLSYNSDTCFDTTHWVVAESEALAHRFVNAVWSYDTLHGGLSVFENGGFRRSEVLLESVAAVKLDDLVLADAAGQELLNDARRFFARRSFYEEHRIPWKRGLLLVGPPGNGKTQTIKAVLAELRLPALYVKSFHSRSHTEENIRCVFERARRQAPGLLVLEDLDCLIDEHCRSVFLNELDGFAANTGLLTIATTNHPEKLDRSILDRPSRFDRRFHFPLPKEPERREYLRRWSAGQPPALQLTVQGIEELVRKSQGFTFAYLKELMLSATLRWVDDAQAGSMDRFALGVAHQLAAQMESAAVLLGPLERKATIGFAECR